VNLRDDMKMIDQTVKLGEHVRDRPLLDILVRTIAAIMNIPMTAMSDTIEPRPIIETVVGRMDLI
jgi:hypothetical protein